MKEHPILFSTPMVQAILEGRKTQTRRIVKPQLNENLHLCRDLVAEYNNGILIKCPYGKKGDLLWIRESWQFDKKFPLSTEEPNKSAFTYFFKADKMDHVQRLIKWRPAIHMPKDAARIWLQIEEVRVERLQDISEEDAKAEGIMVYEKGTDWLEAKFGFQILWETINGIESWHENPWVWVVKFKVLSTTGKPEFN